LALLTKSDSELLLWFCSSMILACGIWLFLVKTYINTVNCLGMYSEMFVISPRGLLYIVVKYIIFNRSSDYFTSLCHNPLFFLYIFLPFLVPMIFCVIVFTAAETYNWDFGSCTCYDNIISIMFFEPLPSFFGC
jgi:hypothetical protein